MRFVLYFIFIIMSQKKNINIQLNLSRFYGVPLQIYDKDFTFIVNGEEFRTNRLIADLISPLISRNHFCDASFDKFEITTTQKGNFTYILNLINFSQFDIPEDQLPFIIEVTKLLDIDLVKINNDQSTSLTKSNVFSILESHLKFGKFYEKNIQDEISFISSHFNELIQDMEKQLLELNYNTLSKVINDPNLRLENEDQLLFFINKLYKKNQTFSKLYEKIIFNNLSQEAIKEFIKVYDFNDMTHTVWCKISERLASTTCQIQTDKTDLNIDRSYIQKVEEEKKEIEKLSFAPNGEKNFNGIINYLNEKSGGKIENVVNLSCSSFYNNFCQPINATFYNDQNKFYLSKDEPNSYICFDFKDRKINPTHYEIRSGKWSPNNDHPKSWEIQGSNDNSTWEVIDTQKDCSYLNGNGLIHTFEINNQLCSEFRYLRLIETSPNWSMKNCLAFDSLEFYGTLV